MINKTNRFLSIYSGILTVVFAVTVFSGFSTSKPKNFDEINVHRINILEPDGTLRFVLSNRNRFPGTYIKGKEEPRSDRPTGGIIFLNDEGSETGGLIWGGSRDEKGNVKSHGHLSFDQYMATQVFAVSAFEEDGERASRMTFTDWRDRPGETGKNRLRLGKFEDKTVGIEIKDGEGRNRIIIKTDAGGNPSIRFLDAEGKETFSLPK
ncbi:MAG: hypothetical protein R2747_18320 [Pyrinomonadaceae bacterium]